MNRRTALAMVMRAGLTGALATLGAPLRWLTGLSPEDRSEGAGPQEARHTEETALWSSDYPGPHRALDEHTILQQAPWNG